VELRIFLAGRVAIDTGSSLVEEHRFPGLQGRVVFAMLAAERERPVSRDELAEELWDESLPRVWETGIRAVVSKLRGVLAEAGLDGGAVLTGAVGLYQLQLPPRAWVDVEAAADALHRAESLLRGGRLDEACGWALAARAITGRPFLPGAEGPWVTGRRDRLRDLHLRALEALAEIWLRRGDAALAVADAGELLRWEPFRESAHRALMRAHAAAGNRAEAVRAYERCRTILADELGINPSADTEAVYLEVLRSA
jgi:DNA-binding SARP family transcriptional activator